MDDVAEVGGFNEGFAEEESDGGDDGFGGGGGQ